jgi:hypothetical protein
VLQKIGVIVSVVILSVALMPRPARAQNTGIAGAVRDTTGAVLAGVTVEAASPALIEKVRSVVTDAQGLYSIIDLRPGTYTVTFSLAGFTTLKREDIELTGSFTAAVNAELKVGSLEETITVSGQSANVDIRNIVQQTVMREDLREGLPTARNVHNMAQLLPGTVQSSGTGRPSSQDVGGLSGDRGIVMSHGGRSSDFNITIDGSTLNLAGGSSQSQAANPAEGQEFVYVVGALSAESQSGGVLANMIPKDGGNRFSLFGLASYTNGSLQSDNLTEALKNKGLSSSNQVLHLFDYNASFGGPIKKDKLWFFASVRYWGEGETIAGVYRPIDPLSFIYNPTLGAAGNQDLSRPVVYDIWTQHYSTRLTWQANAKNKFSFYINHQPREQKGQYLSATRVYEAGTDQRLPKDYMLQATWKAPLTSRFLLEAVVSDVNAPIHQDPIIKGLPNVIPVMDIGTGIQFRAAPTGGYYLNDFRQPNARASASFVTGAHVAKFGVYYERGYNHQSNFQSGKGMDYTLQNGVPRAITEYVIPRDQWVKYTNFGLFAQDQWTIARLTVNAGLRFDYQNGSVPTQTSGPGPFVPFQTWPTVADVPNWKDLSPRLGVAYDLFGTGKTALKATVSRYVVVQALGFPGLANPLSFNLSSSRTWDDRDGDYVPQENELGPLANKNFATAVATTHIDDAIRKGWAVRPQNWEISAGIQHEFMPGLTVNGAYFRRWYGNFTVTDNLAVTPADYTQYCITPPTNASLPDGGGKQICGLYDLNPSKVGQVNNLITFASNYGKQTETNDSVDVSVNARLPYRITVFGGIGSGTSNNVDSINSRSNCFVVNSPQQLRFCDINMPWRTTFKSLATVALPWGIDAGVTFQDVPGPQITANYTVNSAQTQGLSRPLSSGTATIALIQPGTVFGDRTYQVDLRLGKNFKNKESRVRFLLDVANLLNSSAILTLNTTYGTNWLRPTYILPGRLIKPTVQIDF